MAEAEMYGLKGECNIQTKVSDNNTQLRRDQYMLVF